MIALPREMVLEKHAKAAFNPVDFDPIGPIQTGMGGDPWRVSVAAILLNRTRGCQVRRVIRDVLLMWPSPAEMCRAGEELENTIHPCGLWRNRARGLRRFSTGWFAVSWEDLRDLPGIGVFAADCVGLFCFGCVDLESSDTVLRAYVDGRARVAGVSGS